MSEPTLDAVSSAIATVYEAAYDETRWRPAMVSLQRLFNGSRACLGRLDGVPLAVSSIDDDDFTSSDSVAAHWRDPIMGAVAALPAGTIVTRDQLVDGPAFRQRELWHDWYRPRDMFDGLTTKLLSAGAAQWFFDVHRGSRQGAFDVAEVRLLETIVPHLLRAGQIGRQLRNERLFAPGVSDRSLGIAIVDGHLRVHDLNEAFEAAISVPGSALCLSEGQLVAIDPQKHEAFRLMVEQTCSLRDRWMPGPGGDIVLSAAALQGRRSRTHLSVAPFRDAGLCGFSDEGRAVVMMRAVAISTPDGFAERAQFVLGLTKAEAQLAEALLSGQSLKDASEQAGITFKSARTYLDRIFTKTDTSRQNELVALLSALRPMP